MAVNQPVESHHFLYLPIRLEARGRSQQIEALIDTGFDGDVTVPADRLGLGGPDNYQRWTLADGSGVYAPYFLGTVQIGSLMPAEAIVTVLGDEPLIGRGITDRYRLILDHGVRVIVEI